MNKQSLSNKPFIVIILPITGPSLVEGPFRSLWPLAMFAMGNKPVIVV